MPITGPSSYLPTIDEFLAHWEAVDAALGASPLVLSGNVNRGSLLGRRDYLTAERDAVTDGSLERALAREQLNTLIVALQARLVEFNERVRVDLPANPIARVLPVAFAIGDAEGSVRDALRQMSTLWAKVNALATPPPGVTLPMLLMGGYAQAQFDTDRDALRDAYR